MKQMTERFHQLWQLFIKMGELAQKARPQDIQAANQRDERMASTSRSPMGRNTW